MYHAAVCELNCDIWHPLGPLCPSPSVFAVHVASEGFSLGTNFRSKNPFLVCLKAEGVLCSVRDFI